MAAVVVTFRDELTSFTTVTGYGQPGVTVSNGTDLAGTKSSNYGQIAFSDGYGGDADATIIRRALVSRSDFKSGGGGLHLNGGSYTGDAGINNGKAAPVLDLEVDADGAGGYFSRFGVGGADVIDFGGSCFVHQAAQIPWAAGWAPMPLTVVDEDTANGFNTTTWGYTIPHSGTWAIEGLAAFGSLPASAYISARITIDGTFKWRPGSTGNLLQNIAAGGALTAVTGRKRYKLNAGQVVKLEGYCSANATTRVTTDPSTGDGITSTLLIERVG